MKGISRLARWSAIVGTVALVLMASSSLLQHLIRPHERASYFVLLSLVVGVSATFSAMLGACVLELVLSGWSGSSLEALRTGHASTRLDVIATVIMQLPHKYLDYVLSFGLLYVISRYFVTTSLSVAHWLPSWGLQAGCALVLSSLVSYCTHRLEHTIPALWALHKFHHSADRLAILTATRDTKLSGALDLALRALPIAILSVPIAAKPTTASPAYLLVGAYFLLTALLRLNSFLIHSNLDLGYGWIGRWLFVSPRMHRIHHCSSPEYFNRNFSFDLVLWDRLFGTYAHCDEAAQLSVGLIDNPYNSDSSLKGVFRDYFVTTYVEFWKALRKGPWAWLPARRARNVRTHSAAE